MDDTDKSKVFCWIGNLEICLENLQRKAQAIFADNSVQNRTELLELLVSQRSIWGERPTDTIQKLIEKGE